MASEPRVPTLSNDPAAPAGWGGDGAALAGSGAPAAEAVAPLAGAEASAAGADGFCRRCGYALRGLASRACPECGRAFDPADARTFAKRPPRPALRRWARRAAVVVGVVLLAAGAGVGWLWHDWRGEQAAVAQLRAAGAFVAVRPVGPELLRRHWPGRWAHLFDRADRVSKTGGVEMDAATVDWASLRRVRVVELYGVAVTVPAVDRLRRLPHLESVVIYHTPLGRPVHAALSGLPAVTQLGLYRTGTTDADLAALCGAGRLRVLALTFNNVGDEGVAHLAGLGCLESLEMCYSGVTDAGLTSLHGLASLRAVDVRWTAVTADGVRRLRAALPNATILWP